MPRRVLRKSRQPIKYFAYGSNMSGAVLRGRRGLQPLACRPATLPDYRLVFTLPIGMQIHPTAAS